MPRCRTVILFGNRTKIAGNADAGQQLFVVSDGMGGHRAGGIASQIAVELLPKRIARACPAERDLHDPAVQEAVVEAIRCLSQEIHEESKGQPSIKGQGQPLCWL